MRTRLLALALCVACARACRPTAANCCWWLLQALSGTLDTLAALVNRMPRAPDAAAQQRLLQQMQAAVERGQQARQEGQQELDAKAAESHAIRDSRLRQLLASLSLGTGDAAADAAAAGGGVGAGGDGSAE